MAKYYRKRYYRKSNKAGFLKAISRYHYTKLSTFGQIMLDNTGIKFGFNSSQILLAGTALESCNDWKQYTGLFLSYKIRGVKVTLTPNYPQDIDYRGTAAFGYVSNADAASVGDTVESNKSVLLNPMQQSSVYWPLTGGLTEWIPTTYQNMTIGKFQCTTSTNAVSGGIVWSYKIDFYVIFKNTV